MSDVNGAVQNEAADSYKVQDLAGEELSLLAILWCITGRGKANEPNDGEPAVRMADAPPLRSKPVRRAHAPIRTAVNRSISAPSSEQRCNLIRLAIDAGGIDALRLWLDDMEQLIRRRPGRRRGSKYERLDLPLIWGAWEIYRLAVPPISKHAAISCVVDVHWSSLLGASKAAVIKRLERQPWPPEAGTGTKLFFPAK